MARVALKDTDVLLPGDKFEIYANLTGGTWTQAFQVSIIESNLEKSHPEWEVTSKGWTIDGLYYIKGRVLSPSEIPIQTYEAGMGLTIVVSALVASIVTYGIIKITSPTVYKVVETVVEKTIDTEGNVISETTTTTTTEPGETVLDKIKKGLSGVSFAAIAIGLIASYFIFGNRK